MAQGNLPPTDLEALQADVLAAGPDAALPHALSDAWLSLISRDIEYSFGVAFEDDDDDASITAPLALVLSLLLGKNSAVSLPFDSLQSHLQDFRLELALETISRSTNIRADPATLETIFTNRSVVVSLTFPWAPRQSTSS